MGDSNITLRNRIGGRWAISLRAYIISAPLAVFLALVSEPNSLDSLSTVIRWVALSLVAYLALGFVFYVADRTYLENRRVSPSPVWVVLMTDILATETRTAIYLAGYNWVGFESPAHQTSRLFSSFLLAFVWFPVLSYVFDSWERYNNQRTGLINQRVNEELAILRQEQVLDVLQSGLVNEITGTLEPQLKHVRIQLENIPDAVALEHQRDEVIAVLNQVSNESIREVSHQTWQQAEEITRLSVRDLIKAIARTKPFQAWLLTPLIAMLGFFTFYRSNIGFTAAFPALSWAVLVIGICAAGNFFCARYPDDAFQIYWMFIGMLAFTGVIQYAVADYLNVSPQIGTRIAVLAGWSAAFVIPAASSASGVTARRRDVLNELRESIQQTEVRRLAVEKQTNDIKKRISSYLHGTVQASLTAAILRLDSALKSGDRDIALVALNDARQALNLELDKNLGTAQPDLADSLRELAEGWAGLVDLRVLLNAQADSIHDRKRIVQVVTEVTNNAVRHGHADVINVHVSESPENFYVEISNNGEPVVIEHRGLGLAILDELAPNAWNYSTNTDGEVTITVALLK